MSVAYQDLDNRLYRMIQRSFEQTLKTSAPDTQWAVRQANSLEEIQHDHCIVVTISSFKFRVMCLLHLSLSSRTRQFVANATSTKAEDMDETAYLDYLLEMSNSLCGNLKRHMQGSCPPLGMSTPNLLDRSCLDFDDIIEISQSIHATAAADGDSKSMFAVSVLLSLQDDHGFSVDAYQDYGGDTDSESDGAGELELF